MDGHANDRYNNVNSVPCRGTGKLEGQIAQLLRYTLAAYGDPTTADATRNSLLENRQLRAKLADWRRRLADSTEDELEVRRITNEELVPLLAGSLHLAPHFDAVLPWSEGDSLGPGRIIEGRETATLTGEVVLPISTDLSGALALRHFFVEFSAADLTELLALLDQTIELLRAELGGQPFSS